MHLQWDKLFINNEVFVFSEETGSVELETEIHCNVSSLCLQLIRSVGVVSGNNTDQLVELRGGAH